MTQEDKELWYSERIDDDNGVIRYEAHGPKDSFIVFEGNNAKADCALFMQAAEADSSPILTEEEAVEKAARAIFYEYYPQGYESVESYEEAEERHKLTLRRNAKAALAAAGVRFKE